MGAVALIGLVACNATSDSGAEMDATPPDGGMIDNPMDSRAGADGMDANLPDSGAGIDATPPDSDAIGDPMDSGAGADGMDANMPDGGAPEALFSFFVTSLDTMQAQSGSEDGFGGDLGGLAGADAICQTAAANVGFGHKTWRAFLSATTGPAGEPVHAIDRIGDGPWYDRRERLIAEDIAGLQQERPDGDPPAVQDLIDELGIPLTVFTDAHDIMTGSNREGRLEDSDPISTCNDWTSAVGPGSESRVRCGHAWPSPQARPGSSARHWIRAHPLPGCAPGVWTRFTRPGEEGDTVGGQGGWGGIYCFALTP